MKELSRSVPHWRDVTEQPIRVAAQRIVAAVVILLISNSLDPSPLREENIRDI